MPGRATAALGPDIVWSVQALDKHRDALVTQADARLKAVEKASAKAWDHADTQCTSGGVVEVAAVSSHFITLTLEMNCPVAAPENPTTRPRTGWRPALRPGFPQ